MDLNPVHAGLAATPEQGDFTSAQERIADLRSAADVSTADAKDVRIEHGQHRAVNKKPEHDLSCSGR